MSYVLGSLRLIPLHRAIEGPLHELLILAGTLWGSKPLVVLSHLNLELHSIVLTVLLRVCTLIDHSILTDHLVDGYPAILFLRRSQTDWMERPSLLEAHR